ncbi:MDR family MFS transporter [Gulosibacter sediminis]|uniref:MDR family MFS transporter n=1 Tax=Gulosibacter sediminis TaxID=1729695 RepID=UPI0024A9D84C|nr:MDR family MFS transporter [Gulosibacter sediminis]
MTKTLPTAGALPQAQPEKQQSIVMLFVGLLVTMLMSALGQTVLSTALPTIVGELNGADHMAWVVTAFILASTVVMPIYGRISDIFGRKTILVVAIALFMVGSVIGGLAQDMEWLIIARVIQGLGGGGLMILSQAAMADVIPARERGKYMGIFGAVFAVCSVAGPLVGGWLTDGPGWRWAFWMNIPLAVLAIVAVLLFLHPHKREREIPRIDYLGMALIAAATTAVVLVCTWGGTTYDWNSPTIIGLIAGAVVAVIAFALVERKAESPVLPGYLFKNRNFLLTTGASLAVGIAMFGTLGYMPTYIQMVTGVTASEAGLLMTPMMGALLVTSIVSGQVVSRTGRYKAFPLVGLVILSAGLALLSTLAVDSPIWLMCTYLAVMGIGIGFSMQILTLVVQNEFPGRVVGTATAANNYFRQVGATIGSAVVGSFFSARLVDLLTEKMSQLPSGSTGELGATSLTPAVVNGLPDVVREPIIEAYNEALLPILLYIVPLVLVGLVLVSFVKEKNLATTVANEEAEASESAGVTA